MCDERESSSGTLGEIFNETFVGYGWSAFSVVKILQIVERPNTVLLVITKLLDQRTGWTESRKAMI
jgi:hypothetical protein